ncbi:serine hydrolase [Actinomycetospora soli]|uniref:serine hydrolase n=1 Tax=Actinomycetospora soli TaxID=2893887 RepID=UPI001E60D802|nr:serine hydrolase [Actinomycetospora soli]MCD2189942.1 class A beta-lactamase-related serine hydrolase [Actinomycetospora soli]
MSRFRILVITVLGLVLVGCGSAPAAPSEPPRPADCPAPTSSDLTTADGWLGRIAGQPDTVGLVLDDGRGRVVSHEADRPFPLASAVKVVHLTAYAAAVADGRIRPDEQVARADWERWYVPGTDGDAHPTALQRLGPGPDYAVDQLVTAMIRESDNAAADWLRARLGDDALRAAAASTGWVDVDLPSFAGGAARLAMPDLAPAGADRARLAVLDAELGRRVADEPAFHDEVVRRIAAAVRQDPAQFVADNEAWTATSALGTPAQLLGVHRAIATGSVPGADVAARHLTWQGPSSSGTIGFKGGSFVDVLTFGGFLRRTDGSVGYAVILGRDLPVVPLTGQQARGQQELVLDALRSPGGLDRLACVA